MIDLPAIPQEKVSFGHPDWILVNNAYGPACDLVAQYADHFAELSRRGVSQRCVEVQFERKITDWSTV